MFSQRLGDDQKSYMTRHEFLTRFWAAYTYEELVDESKEQLGQEEQKEAI